MDLHLAYNEAHSFFSELFHGAHHIPSGKVHEHGYGYCVKYNQGAMATYDSNTLTRFVLMCHRDCYRGEISGNGMHGLKIAIWKRQPDGKLYERHPTLEQAMKLFAHSL